MPQQQQQLNVPIASANVAQQQQPMGGLPLSAQMPGAAGTVAQGGVAQPGTAAPSNVNPAPARERQFIWQGIIEWQEKTRDPQKLPRHVPCQVSAAVMNGETEV